MNIRSASDSKKSSEGDVALLLSLADETRGRDASQLRNLARRLDRGETASFEELLADPRIALSPYSLGAYLALANDGSVFEEAALNATRHEMAHAIRRRLVLCVLVGLFYLLASQVVGVSLIRALAPIASEISHLYWWGPINAITQWPLSMIEVAYLSFATATLTIISLFCWRAILIAPRWLEYLFDTIPLVGSTLRSLELAEMSHSIHQCVSANRTYVDAFEITAHRTRSSRLRKWLLSSAALLGSGQEVEQVFRRLPLHGEWLSGWTSGIGETTRQQTRELWSIAAERMFEVATNRVERSCQIIPTLLMVVSAAVALIAFALSFNSVLDALGFLS